MKHYWLPHELEACWSLAADEEALLAGRTELNPNLAIISFTPARS